MGLRVQYLVNQFCYDMIFDGFGLKNDGLGLSCFAGY